MKIGRRTDRGDQTECAGRVTMGWMQVPRQMRLILETDEAVYAVVLDESEINRIEQLYHTELAKERAAWGRSLADGSPST